MADTKTITSDESIVRKATLAYYDTKIKAWANEQIDNAIDGGFKDVKYANSTVYFFDGVAPVTADEYATKAVKSVNLPEEQVLDQAKTSVVDSFAWSAETYPESTNPNLDGKPVLVLAVKGESGSVSYSFVSLGKLVDPFTFADSNTIDFTANGYDVTADVKISAEEGNIISAKGDGIYAANQDLSDKADKVAGAVEGNLAKLDANGNLADAGVKEADFVKKTATIAGVDLADDITKEEMLTALNVADGAQVNILESVKVNGTALDITGKAVDITVASGTANGTIAVNGADVAVKGYADLADTVGDATKGLVKSVTENTAAVAKLNGADTEEGSVAYAVKALADGAVKTNTDAITKLNGTGEGSVTDTVDKAIEAYKSTITYVTNDDIDALFN